MEALDLLKRRGGESATISSHFQLTDSIFMSASIPPTTKVNLWLGADVMLEYEIDEALALITKNRSQAIKNLARLEEDYDYLRDQLTTMEVNIARIHNWGVMEQRKKTDESTANKATAE